MSESYRTRPASVWDTGRDNLHTQLADRYIPPTRTDTLTLSPVLARQIITTYTTPGAVVLDPDTHAGIVPCEALRAGRHGVGVHTARGLSRRVCAANLARAHSHPNNIDTPTGTGTATLLDGLDDPRAARLPGAVDLLLTALRPGPHTDPTRLLDTLRHTLDTATNWVWPGGHLVITTPPCYRHGLLVDLPSQIHQITDTLGLLPVDHCIALTRPIRRQQISIPASTPPPRRGAAHRNQSSLPAIAVHVDVLVFWLPPDQSATSNAVRSPAPLTLLRPNTAHRGTPPTLADPATDHTQDVALAYATDTEPGWRDLHQGRGSAA